MHTYIFPYFSSSDKSVKIYFSSVPRRGPGMFQVKDISPNMDSLHLPCYSKSSVSEDIMLLPRSLIYKWSCKSSILHPLKMSFLLQSVWGDRELSGPSSIVILQQAFMSSVKKARALIYFVLLLLLLLLFVCFLAWAKIVVIIVHFVSPDLTEFWGQGLLIKTCTCANYGSLFIHYS